MEDVVTHSPTDTPAAGSPSDPKTTTRPAARTSGWIPELEGLRGLLSLWVFLGHCLGLSGYSDANMPRWLLPLRSGTLAVDVFIILSGFVIASLLGRERLPWLPFMVRRWFRLFPAYAVCLLLGFFALGAMGRLGDATNLGDVGTLIRARWIQTEDHLAAHAVAHALMLHGALPNEILPYSTGAFVDAAWSISLEWQFYLIAPWLIPLLQRRMWAWGACAVIALVAIVANGRLYHFDFAAFLPLKLHYFAIGILSWMLHSRRLPLESPATIGVSAGLFWMVLMRGNEAIPLFLWCVVLGMIWNPTPSAGLNSLTRRFLCWGPMLKMGLISYGFYLCHQPLQIWVRAALVGSAYESSRAQTFAILFAISGVAAIALASLLHIAVEKPGMACGKHLANWLRARGQATANGG